MEVILLERIGKLGQMGDVVRVKDGYARNFLLRRGKALRATDDNKSKFEGMKAELQARNLELKGGAEKVASKLDGKTIGLYKVPLTLHPEVETIVTVIVARSAGEAERVARGEDVTVRREDAEEKAAAALANAEAFFEPEAAKALREGDEAPEAEAEAGAEVSAAENKPAKKARSKKKTAEGSNNPE